MNKYVDAVAYTIGSFIGLVITIVLWPVIVIEAVIYALRRAQNGK